VGYRGRHREILVSLAARHSVKLFDGMYFDGVAGDVPIDIFFASTSVGRRGEEISRTGNFRRHVDTDNFG
jgi:hypothetical protein